MYEIFLLVLIADLGSTYPRPWEMPVAGYTSMEFCTQAREHYERDPTLARYLNYRCKVIELRR
jgi:hypothetical protein